MRFFTKPREVQAQQFSNPEHPEWVTIVKLEAVPGCTNIFGFHDNELDEFRTVLPYDWIVLWQEGSVDVFSSMDFEYRFTTEPEHKTLKESIDNLAIQLKFIRGVKQAKRIKSLERLVNAHQQE